MMVNREAKMMNIVAVWMLVSSLGAAMVLSPEPILTTPGEPSHPLKAAKDASKQSVEYAADAARKTGEAIRQTVAAGVHSTGEFASSVMDAAKDPSQAGLEKIGLATPEKSTFEQWESGLQAAKDRATAAGMDSRGAAAEVADSAKLSAREKYENLKKHGGLEAPGITELTKEKYDNLKMYGQLEPPSTAEAIKDKAVGAFDATKDAAGDAVTAVKDTVVGAGETIQEGAHYTFRPAEEAAAAAKDKVENAAGSLKERSKETLGYGEEKSSQSADSVSELASRIAQAVQENVKAAGSKAYDTADSAKISTAETMGTAYEYAADALGNAGEKMPKLPAQEESDPSYQEKLRVATEQAADILRRRAKEAASYMPNVGQGLSMGEISDSDLKKEASEYVDSAKDKAGDYHEGAKETITGNEKESPTNWRETFLNKIGIREESDLSKLDVMVGNLKSFWIGRDESCRGVFQMPGDIVTDATTGTKEGARTMMDKVSDSMYNVADRIRHAKDSFVSRAKHMRGTDKAEGRTKDEVGDSGSDTLSGMQSNYTISADSKDVAKRNEYSSSLLRWMGYATVAWIVSSIRAVHLLSFSFTYGASLWVTFISGYLLSKSLAKQQYGFVQSKMFPTYLRLIGVGQAVCLVFYMILHPWTRSSSAERLQHFNLWIVLVSTLVNLLFLEPRATKTMFEKMKIEKEEGSRAEEEAAKRASDLKEAPTSSDGDHPTKTHLNEINRRFNVLHGWSSTFNLLGLMGETWHLWHLSRALAV